MNKTSETLTLKRLAAGLALALGLFVTPVFPADLISNGSFETGKDFAGAAYTAVDPGTADLPGWTGPAGFEWYINGPVWGTPAQDGTRFMNLISLAGTWPLSQSFAVTAGTVYTVSYYEMYRGVGGIMDTTLSVAAGTVTGAAGTPVAVSAGPATSIVQATATGNAAWTLHTFTFTASSNTTATIAFGNHYDGNGGDNDGVFLDNVSVHPYNCEYQIIGGTCTLWDLKDLSEGDRFWNFGDVKPVREGVSELRVDYGPGYRVYFLRQGETLVVLLGGGDKRTQSRDIQRAIALSRVV